MNVYEEAHNLSRAIRESGEFIEFDRLRKEIEKDESLYAMIRDIERKQLELQARQMAGEDVDPASAMEQIQGLYRMIAGKPEAAAYLQAEARFAVMVKDVYEILSDVIQIKS